MWWTMDFLALLCVAGEARASCEQVESLAKRKMLQIQELAQLFAIKCNALDGPLR
jgi:hypothetical protein